ncbi:SH3 domain-containing protein [Streptomyces sp. KLOTTS4A1]|uniref:SH3 domain-containing protein n=1 Tax=Streptomyces sp. KLOTTS4A1 TaxID=3390996 RepID=UPI0039F4A5EC
MRTSPVLRTLAASCVAAAALTVSAAGPSQAASVPATTSAAGAPPGAVPLWENGPIWGTAVAGTLNLRAEPHTWSAVVGQLSYGERERIKCAVYGENINGNASWFWLTESRGWASGAYLSTSRGVPDCGDWRPSGGGHHRDDHRHGHDNPCRVNDECDACRDGGWWWSAGVWWAFGHD